MSGRRWLELAIRADGRLAAGPPVESDADRGAGSDPPPAETLDADALIVDALIELGARGVVEEGGRLVAWFEEPDDPEAFLSSARSALDALPGIGAPRIEHGWQEQEEWAETWRRGLGPRRITDRIVVHPSWAEPHDVRADDVVIVLDPGMAFGTAEHGTTRGCLRLLDRTVERGDRVLDVGAGSGILSIAAALLGAREVVAIEGDPLACEAAEENLRRNGVGGTVRLVEAWVAADDIVARGPFQGIVSNIDTHLLVPLLGGFGPALAEGGWLIVSGILDHELTGVTAELRELGFTPVDVDEDGEWRSGAFERSA